MASSSSTLRAPANPFVSCAADSDLAFLDLAAERLASLAGAASAARPTPSVTRRVCWTTLVDTASALQDPSYAPLPLALFRGAQAQDTREIRAADFRNRVWCIMCWFRAWRPCSSPYSSTTSTPIARAGGYLPGGMKRRVLRYIYLGVAANPADPNQERPAAGLPGILVSTLD